MIHVDIIQLIWNGNGWDIGYQAARNISGSLTIHMLANEALRNITNTLALMLRLV